MIVDHDLYVDQICALISKGLFGGDGIDAFLSKSDIVAFTAG